MDDRLEKAIREIKDILVKNFSTARKLTEGDNAFQQYAMENKDRNGSSTEPIIIQEPPVRKADISTMAPKENIGENGAKNAIEYDNPVDKVKKDYARHGLGAFSTQHMIPGEMSNQVSAPEEVDAAVETRKRTALTDNKEPYCEKMDKGMYSSLKKAMNLWFLGIDENTSIEDALVSLKKSLVKWDFDILQKNADVTVPILHSFVDDIFKNTKEIIKSKPMGTYIQKKAIDSEIKKCILKL